MTPITRELKRLAKQYRWAVISGDDISGHQTRDEARADLRWWRRHPEVRDRILHGHGYRLAVVDLRGGVA